MFVHGGNNEVLVMQRPWTLLDGNAEQDRNTESQMCTKRLNTDRPLPVRLDGN
jgi:hypothetical protein